MPKTGAGNAGSSVEAESPTTPPREMRSAPLADVIGGEPSPRITIGVADQSLDAVSNRLSAHAALARFLRLAAAFVLFAVRFHQVRF